MATSALSTDTLTVQGITIPKLGFGTWQLTGDECEEAVHDALDVGYRHIDTARAYGNEDDVGRAIRDSDVPREEIFLTTKIWFDDFAPDDLALATEDSLRRLAVEQVDLLLLHWPGDESKLEQTLGALTEMRERGHTRAIGVSNFPPRLVRSALEHAPLICDQVEYHAFLGQPELLEIADEHDLAITAYAPLAHGKVLEDETLNAIGEAHDKTAAQVALRWLLDRRRVVAIPKASSHENRHANADIHDFQLTSEERAQIEALPKDQREIDPDFAPDWD